MEALTVQTLLDDAVARRSEKEDPQRDEKRGERRQLEGPVSGGEPIVAFLEKGAVLEPEQHLRAEHQDTHLVERVLHFLPQVSHLDIYTPGVPMSDEQARSIYQLMMLTAWADGCLEAPEALVAEAVQGDVPELRQLPDRGALADRAKKRLDQLGLERALAETAAGLADAGHRELAFVCCARILEADGIIAQEEFKLLSQLKALFGLSTSDVTRLLQRAARS